MSEKKKKKMGKSVTWVGSGPDGQSKAAGLIALIGVAAITLGCLAQNSALSNTTAFAAKDSPIRINEIMSENGSTLQSGNGDAVDWIEITNTGDSAVNLHNYSMMLGSSVKKVYSFPDMQIDPGEYIIIECTGVNGSNTAPFKLAASGGDTVLLMNARGTVIDSVTMPELNLDESYCRYDAETWKISSVATPGAENIIDENVQERETKIAIVPGQLEISEVMTANTLYYPDSDGDTNDYVELHNISGGRVNLKGWCLSDSSDKLRKWEFPSVTIEPDGYIVAYCSGKDRKADTSGLHTNFKLGRDGEDVYLTSPEGKTTSMVAVPALQRNQAYSLTGGVWTTTVGPTPWLVNSSDAAAQVSAQMNAGNNSGVIINEIMASPSTKSSDWVELYNTSSTPVDISGWGLSDDAAKPRKYQFPSGTTINPGEYLGVFMSSSPDARVGEYLNTGFALSMDGGYTMSLSRPDGTLLESIYIPQQYSGISYGRAEGRSGYYYFENGTPGSANNGTFYSGRAQQAEYSVRGGLFRTGDTFTVELSAPEGSHIFYTLDSSDPDQTDTLYTAPIEVSGTTILRTRVYRDGCMPSYMDTQSYLYDVNNAGNSVYVVSLVSDMYNLTSDEAGIMVKGPNALEQFPYGSMNKGANFWMDWEREAHVELYTKDGEQALSQECGIKLHGQYSRATPIKAFKVIARSEYGDNTFSYPIFSHRDYKDYQSFVLRASGQDYNLAFMRDSLLTSLARDTSVMYMEHELAVVYIDGQYYSMMYLRERINTHSICQFEGWEGQEDDIDLIKANSGVKQGSNDTFADLLTWIKAHDPTTQEMYDKIDSAIDIQNYIEYMAMEIFSGNGDTLNVKRYRNKNADGKWRWVLFDLDWAFWVDTNSIARWLDPTGMGTGKRTDTTLFIACMKNSTFREKFLTHFGQRLAQDFSSASIVPKIQERYYQLEPLLSDYLQRINMSGSSYSKQLRKLVGYAESRPSKILEYFDGVFKFSDADKQKYFGDAIEKINSYKNS